MLKMERRDIHLCRWNVRWRVWGDDLSDGHHGIRATKDGSDDEIVCLGNGVENTTTNNVTTSINQCHLKNDVVLLSKRAR